MLATNTDPRKKINKAAVSLLLRHPFSAVFCTATKCSSRRQSKLLPCQ